VSTAPEKTHVLGRGALRTYQFLLDQGGWWAAREMVHELNLTGGASLNRQLLALHQHKCVVRKGTGVAGDAYRYGVTLACVDPTKGLCS
jgi:hypothetical protein